MCQPTNETSLLATAMQQALQSAEENLHTGDGGPFGACIVRNGEVIVTAHNTVLRDKDATCHAEINSIRAASRLLARYDLSDCVIYSTTEPCPMCFSAIHWAGISHIIYGTCIQDVQKLGFNELPISNQQMNQLGQAGMRIQADFLRPACEALLQKWAVCEHRHAY